jgi:hypothetical protein|tara:strand:+ start:2904 stop:3107 length:204 start_codon:yes stop_codon:yes gene_type:complete
MKVGDLVKFKKKSVIFFPEQVPSPSACGVIVNINEDHRQTTVDVLTEVGSLYTKIWTAHLEVINETS